MMEQNIPMEPQVLSDIRGLPKLSDYGEVVSNITNYQAQRRIKYTDTATVQSDNFSRGVLDFCFDIGAGEIWDCSSTYFKSNVKLTVKTNQAGEDAGFGTVGEWRQPVAQDKLALAENFMANLLSSCSFYISNTVVSTCTDYVAQKSMLNYRLTKNKTWLEGVGGDVFYLDSSFESRQDKVSSNGVLETQTVVELGYADGTDVTILDATPLGHTASFATSTINDTTKWIAGDVLQYRSAAGPIINALVTSVSVDELELDDGYPAADAVSPNSSQAKRVRVDNTHSGAADGKNEFTVLFQPPLSILYSNEYIPNNGTYKFKLVPKTDKKSAFQTEGEEFDSPFASEASLIIKDIILVVKTFKSTNKLAMDGEYVLQLSEWGMQNKLANQGIGQTTHTMTVEVTTNLIAVFFQDAGAGYLTNVPPSKFIASDNSTNNLQTLSVSYAGIKRNLKVKHKK